jgi:hypothetical protein
MTSEHGRVSALVSELSFIEFENKRLLDDNSIRLVAEVRSQKLLTDDEWSRIKYFLQEALEFLSDVQKMTPHVDGQTLDPFSDPRNADWLRTYTACRLAGHVLPDWAALWLWRLRTDTSPTFWFKIGQIAGRLGYPKFASDNAS